VVNYAHGTRRVLVLEQNKQHACPVPTITCVGMILHLSRKISSEILNFSSLNLLHKSFHANKSASNRVEI